MAGKINAWAGAVENNSMIFRAEQG